MDDKLIITIARQYGSGGRYLGQQLSKQLGIPFYDKDLIQMAAEQSGLDPELFRKAEEAPSNSFWNTLASGLNPFGGHTEFNGELPLNDKLFLVQSQVILDIAKQGSCIIVGRCSDYVLQDEPNALHVFVYGTPEDRISNLTRFYGVDVEEAPKLIQKIDKKRASYYNYYTGRKWGLPDNYHMSINSSVLGIQKTADAVAYFAKLKIGQ